MAGKTPGRQRNVDDTSRAWQHLQNLSDRDLPRNGNRLVNLISLAGGKRGY